MKSFPKSEWILWVGAGISYPEPTRIPLGAKLSESVVGSVFGEQVNESLASLWKKANELVRTQSNSQPFGASPRLETILGVVDNVENFNKDVKFNFMSGFKCLTKAPYNTNHICIAKLISEGATVITTNFDTCIQTAFSEIYSQGLKLRPKKIENAYLFESESESAGNLWHIHGVAQDIEGLGATIRKVKQGLPQLFTDEIDKLLSSRSLVLFLGYSASDSFDVNIYFSAKSEREFSNSSGIFLQHPTAEIPASADIVLKPFGQKLKDSADTSEFLNSISDVRSDLAGSISFDWAKSFKSETVMDEIDIIRGYAICRLARELGLSYSILDKNAYVEALKYSDFFNDWELHRTLASNSRMNGMSKQEREHDNLAGDSDLLGYYFSQGDIRSALKVAKSIEQLFKESNDFSLELNWKSYTSMSVHCRPIITKYLISPFKRRVTDDDKDQIRTRLDLTDRFGNRPLKGVESLNQVVTAMRFSTLFRTLIYGNEDLDTEKYILHIYGEASSIQGFVSAYRDFAIKRILMMKYHSKQIMPDYSMKYIELSRKLALLIGDVHGVKRAKQLKYLYLIHNLIFRKK